MHRDGENDAGARTLARVEAERPREKGDRHPRESHGATRGNVEKTHGRVKSLVVPNPFPGTEELQSLLPCTSEDMELGSGAVRVSPSLFRQPPLVLSA